MLTAGFIRFDIGRVDPSKIAIIVMYKAQGTLIRQILKMAIGDQTASVKIITISTVDAFQGKENHIIIMSLVTHGVDQHDHRVSNFFTKPNRLCVGISRAIAGFALIGNGEGLWRATDHTVKSNMLNSEPAIRRLIGMYRQRGCYFSHKMSDFSDNSAQAKLLKEEQEAAVLRRDIHVQNGATELFGRAVLKGGNAAQFS